MKKEFKTQNGKTIQVEGGSGHSTLVYPDWTEIHQRFWQNAYALGCISKDMVENTANEYVDEKAVKSINRIAIRNKEITDAMRSMYENNEEENFSNGKPVVKRIIELVGYQINSAERNHLWEKLQDELK